MSRFEIRDKFLFGRETVQGNFGFNTLFPHRTGILAGQA